MAVDTGHTDLIQCAYRETPNERAAMGKPADSVRLEVESSPPDKEGNERNLARMAAEFFGHDTFDVGQGYRHQLDRDGSLFTSAIFYDETPYE